MASSDDEIFRVIDVAVRADAVAFDASRQVAYITKTTHMIFMLSYAPLVLNVLAKADAEVILTCVGELNRVGYVNGQKYFQIDIMSTSSNGSTKCCELCGPPAGSRSSSDE